MTKKTLQGPHKILIRFNIARVFENLCLIIINFLIKIHHLFSITRKIDEEIASLVINFSYLQDH